MTESQTTPASGQSPADSDDEISLLDLLIPLAQNWRLLVLGPLAAGVLALGGSFLIKPTFTSTTTFLPPQQQQSAAASALAQLGGLAGVAGAAAGIKSPADQYVALLQSVRVSDQIIDQFKLMEVYEAKYRVNARKALDANSNIAAGKKDGLISISIDDHDPQRAAAIANAYVEQLRKLTTELAVTEAQQRRVFFERQMLSTKEKLVQAQTNLQASGFTAGALKAEPKAAAEGYATLRAQLTAARIKLQVLRASMNDTAPEVRQQAATAAALEQQLNVLEAGDAPKSGSADYISKYREYKYQEALLDLFTRQFELAKVDESREGALIQVLDVAQPAELKTKPKRTLIAVATTLAAGLAFVFFILVRIALRRAGENPENAQRLSAIRQGLSLRG
jgi:uncharacterized protein involved in exopolysaccharide biosynthesis